MNDDWSFQLVLASGIDSDEPDVKVRIRPDAYEFEISGSRASGSNPRALAQQLQRLVNLIEAFSVAP
jgi:hypothetical protein